MADITVQVVSAGLTAYGSQTWGSKTYGGDQTASTTVGSADAFNNQGWGRLSWNSLVWNQDFENISVAVVTPGKGTPWGLDVWSDAEWGQISGMDTDQGSAELTVSVDAGVTGEQLNTTTATAVAGASAEVFLTGITDLQTFTGDEFGGELVTVPVTSPSHDEWGTEYWGSGQWGVGDGVTVITGQPDISGDANVEVSGEQIAFQAVGTVEIPVVIDEGILINSTLGDAFGGEVVEVQVTTASAQPWGETAWGDGQWGQSVGTDISQGGEEVAIPSIEIDAVGIPTTSNTEDVFVTGDANVTLTALDQLSINLGNENAFTNVRVEPTGVQFGPIIIGNFLAGISAEVNATGVTVSATTGIIGLNAWAVVDPGSEPTWTVVDIAA